MMANASPRVPVGGVLTPRMERMIRLGSIGSAVIIAISAMVLSYAGLHDLALDAEIHPRFALLVPIMVDGLQFVGSIGVVYSTLSGLRSWYPWVLMLMGVSVSAWGNWQAAPDQLTAKLLHAAAPIILALVLEELLRVMRHKVHLHAEREAALAVEAEQAADAADGQVAAPVPAPVPSQVAERVAQPVAAPVAAPTPSTALPTAPTTTDAQPLARPQGQEVAPTATQPVALAPVALTSGPIVQTAVTEVVEDAKPTDSADATAVAPAVEADPQTSVTTTDPAPEAKAVESKPRASTDGLPPYPKDATYKEQVRAILEQDPTLTAGAIAKAMGKDASNTRKIVKEWRAEFEAAEATPQPSAPAPAPVAATVPPQTVRPMPTQAPAPAQAPVQASVPAPAPRELPEVVDFAGADPFATSAPVGAGR